MSKTTENLELFEYDTQTDGKQKFNITKALNNNFDKIDEAIGNIKGLPIQTNNAGKFLSTDGQNASWQQINISDAVEFRNYIKSCAVNASGNAEVIKNISNGEISEQVAISLANSNNSSNISGTGFTSSNGGYDGLNSTVTRSYTLNNSVSAVQSVAVTLRQYAAHRAGSGVWVDAVFSDGTTQRVGTQTGGGDTNVTKTYSIAVEGLKTLTGFNVTANHSAWSNGYCDSSVSASNFTCTHLKTVSSAITLNATEETPIQYVPSDGVTRSITQALGKDFSSGYADGTYHLFASENATTTTITYSKGRVAPVSPANGNYWLDTSSTPTKLKKCIVTSVTNGESDDAVTTTTAEWQETNDIYVGSVTVASNVITGVTQPITKGADCPATVVKTYRNGTSWYRIWSDGWCEQGGNTQSAVNGKYTITLLKPYKTIVGASATSWADCNYAIISTPSLSTIAVETRGFDHTVQPCTAFWFIYGYVI